MPRFLVHAICTHIPLIVPFVQPREPGGEVQGTVQVRKAKQAAWFTRRRAGKFLSNRCVQTKTTYKTKCADSKKNKQTRDCIVQRYIDGTNLRLCLCFQTLTIIQNDIAKGRFGQLDGFQIDDLIVQSSPLIKEGKVCTFPADPRFIPVEPIPLVTSDSDSKSLSSRFFFRRNRVRSGYLSSRRKLCGRKTQIHLSLHERLARQKLRV